MEYKLGGKVRFNAEIVRKHYSAINRSLNFREVKNLNENGMLPEDYTRYRRNEHKVQKEGIVCGVRNIGFKGFSDYRGYEEGYEFVVIESRQVYLIATNMKGFHRVLPEDIEKSI